MGCAPCAPLEITPADPTSTHDTPATLPEISCEVHSLITPPEPTTYEESGNDPVALSAAASDAATAADERSEAPTAIDRVTDAREWAEFVADAAATAVNTAQDILAQLPPDVSDSLAAGATGVLAAAGQVAVANAPKVAAFLGSLCGTAADLLGAIVPAIPFAGAAAAVLAIALKQGEACAEAFKAVYNLRQTIQVRRPTIERFVGEASLAAQHAALVGHAAQALRDAV